MNLFAAAKLASAPKDGKKTIGTLFKIGLIALTAPIVLFGLILTAIIYLITTPLPEVLTLFTDAGVEMPEEVKGLKTEVAFLTYEYVTGAAHSPPTYNNVVLEEFDEESHPRITFKGSSLFWKRCAYAIDVGVITELEDDSITIEHQFGFDEETGAPLIYHARYTGLVFDNDVPKKDMLGVGVEVIPGRKLATLKMSTRFEFEMLQIIDAEEIPVDPGGFINLDTVELSPDSDGADYTAVVTEAPTGDADKDDAEESPE